MGKASIIQGRSQEVIQIQGQNESLICFRLKVAQRLILEFHFVEKVLMTGIACAIGLVSQFLQ